MKLNEIYNTVDGLAPFSLSREYCEKFDAYDNSGVMLDCGGNVERVLFSLDCSLRAAERAVSTGAQLLITHHPAIYAPVKGLAADNPVTVCAKAGVSVLSAHLNLDCAAGGIDDCLAAGLGAKGGAARMHTLSCGGYGSAFTVEETPFAAFLERVKANFQSGRIVSYGDRSVKKIASFCGAGFDEESIEFALGCGADTFVSSDQKHHLLLKAIENNLNVVVLPHYAAENYGFKRFYEKIKEKCPSVRMEYFADERFM